MQNCFYKSFKAWYDVCNYEVRQKGLLFLEYLSHSVAETEDLGARLAAVLSPGAVVAYTGGLGMGKTAFTRGLARGLGCRGRVTSPTFTIVNEYDGPTPLFHFDMYRLPDADALFDIGWEDYLSRGGVCAVEWSENVEDALQDAIRVTIEKDADEPDTRHITITGGPRFEDPCL